MAEPEPIILWGLGEKAIQAPKQKTITFHNSAIHRSN